MDFLSDRSGRHLLRLSQLMTVPDYVAQAPAHPEAAQDLPDHLFAKRASREFPIDSPGHVFLSYAYCRATGCNETEVLSRIKSAADKLGLAGDLAQVDAAYDAAVKQAAAPAPAPTHAVVLDFGPPKPEGNSFEKQGGVQSFYAMHTPAALITSAQQLCDDKDCLPLEVFAAGCRELVTKAASFQLDPGALPAKVRAYGQERLPNPEFVRQQGQARQEQTGQEIFSKLATLATTNPENRPMEDYTKLWLEADRTLGVKYSEALLDPYLVFQSGPCKQAYTTELQNWTLINDVPVPKSALAELPAAEVQKCFPKEAADKLLLICKQASTSTTSDLSQLLEQNLTRPQRKDLLGLLARL